VTATYETSVLATDLEPGDLLLTSGIGGHEGAIRAVRVYPDYVAVDFVDGSSAAFSVYEACSVRRRVRVHPELAKVIDFARRMGQ